MSCELIKISSHDFTHFYCKSLPLRTEGLSESSISAMLLQTSPIWRKNWIKFRAFRSISFSLFRSRFLLLSGTSVVEKMTDYDWLITQSSFTLESAVRKWRKCKHDEFCQINSAKKVNYRLITTKRVLNDINSRHRG